MGPKIRLSLKKVPGKKKRAIQLSLNAGFKTVDTFTGNTKYSTLKLLLPGRILPSNWDLDSERPTSEFSTKDKFRLHNEIDRHVKLVLKAFKQVEESPLIEVVTPSAVRSEYDVLTGKHRRVRVRSRITWFIEKYIHTSRTEKDSTKSQYQLLSNRIAQFEVATRQALFWQDYSFEIHEQFMAWLQDTFELSSNTLWNYEKLVLKFRALARTQGLLQDANDWRRVTRYKQTEKMYLDWEMIRKIMDFEPTSPNLKNTKSIFIILLFTGIRVSDLHRFVVNYQDDHPFGWSNFRLSKAPNPEVVIPGMEPVRHVMMHSPPYDTSTTTLHSRIKHLMSKVFDAQTAKKISAHTARRSFITNLLPHVQEGVLRKITGHALPSSSKVFFGYDRLSLKENAIVFMRQIKSVPKNETCGIVLARFTEEIKLN